MYSIMITNRGIKYDSKTAIQDHVYIIKKSSNCNKTSLGSFMYFLMNISSNSYELNSTSCNIV